MVFVSLFTLLGGFLVVDFRTNNIWMWLENQLYIRIPNPTGRKYGLRTHVCTKDSGQIIVLSDVVLVMTQYTWLDDCILCRISAKFEWLLW